MTREQIIASIQGLAEQLGTVSEGSEWFIFGSVMRGEPDAADIDLMILCSNDTQADALRRALDPDSLSLPIDLAFLTYSEAQEVHAVEVQQAERVYPNQL